MFSILGFIIFFIFIILFFGLTIISGVLRVLFGFGRRNSSGKANDSAHSDNKERERDTPKRKKLFDDDEGEYVEFEEIKKEDKD